MVEQGSSVPAPGAPRARRGRAGAALLVVLILMAGAFVGGLFTVAFGQPSGPWHMGAMDGPFDPARAVAHVDRAIKHLAIEADATADQQTKLVGIAEAAVKDLLPLREKAQANRKQALDLFTAPTIDRAAVEKLRSEQLALAETASKRIAQALADAADVLSADQRKTLVERMASHGRWWGHWHRG
jgi:Spy/CpxP family protein refolding chaperone